MRPKSFEQQAQSLLITANVINIGNSSSSYDDTSLLIQLEYLVQI